MKISVIMANYCGARDLEAAIASVLRQTHSELELIVADDASPDRSVEIVNGWASRDPRVILLKADRNAGAAAARNRGLDAATGDWIAVVDSDDIIHPDRLRRLLAAAQHHDVQMVADDMVFFSDTPDGAGRTLLQDLGLTAPHPIRAADLLRSDLPDAGLPPFGYLKFLVSRAAIGDLRYDETLLVAEDFDFYLRLLQGGARALALPDPMYLYRRHSASLSHRLSSAALERMLAAQSRLAARSGPEFDAILARRGAHLRHLLAYQRLVDALKARRWGAAAARLVRRPGLLIELARSLAARRDRAAQQTATRSTQTLILGTGGAADLGPVPKPGDAWASPPAQACATISALAARHQLAVEAHGLAGLWALWLVPDWHAARLRLPEGTAPDLPVPDGVTIAAT